MPRRESRAGAPRALLRVLACALFAFTSLYLVHQQARSRVGLSGDEYYFYYAAAHRYVGNPSDPVWAAQDMLRNASLSLEVASEGDDRCARATAVAQADLRELGSLLRMETSGQGYGTGSVFHGAVLRAWQFLHSAQGPDNAPYAAQLGRRIAASITWPMVVVIAACFVVLAFQGSVVAICALGFYVVLHSVLTPAPEAYWTLATQHLESAWWIVSTAVGLPFLNPRYSDSLVALAPRGYLVLPFLLVLALRWVGSTRGSYALAASLPLFHPPIGAMIFLMLCAVDVLARPQVFKDRGVLAITLAALLLIATGPSADLFLALAGDGRFPVAVLLTFLGAVLYVVWMPRWPRFRCWSEVASRNVLLLDVLVFGPIFLLAWFVLALLTVRYGIVTPYGLVNLATKSGPVAHHVVLFGLFCFALTQLLALLQHRLGEARSGSLALLCTAAASVLLAVAFGPGLAKGNGTVRQRFIAIAQAHDDIVQQRPLKLGAFETHLLWHRIVRQRETGGDWLRGAVDLTPYRAQCPRLK